MGNIKQKLTAAQQVKLFVDNAKILRKFGESPKIFAVDPGRNSCGWAFAGKRFTSGTVRPPKKTNSSFGQAVAVANRISELIDEFEPDFVFVENYAFGRIYARELCGENQALILVKLHDDKIPLMKPSPNQIKNFVCAGKKEKTMMMVLDIWGIKTETNDEADAVALAMMGKALFRVVSKVKKVKSTMKKKELERVFKKICKDDDLNDKQATTLLGLVIRKVGDIWL